MHIPKWLIATAGMLFVVLVATLAFFLGRETSHPPTESIAASAAARDRPAVSDASPSPEPAPVADARGGAVTSPLAAAPSPTSTTDPPSTANASPSSPAAAVDTLQPSADARVRVSDYLRQMNALQSGGPGGDPDAFANTILQGATSGDFSALDDLVRTAREAERRALALHPPAECADYHRMVVTLLQDSATMMTALRDGLKRNDADALTSL